MTKQMIWFAKKRWVYLLEK